MTLIDYFAWGLMALAVGIGLLAFIEGFVRLWRLRHANPMPPAEPLESQDCGERGRNRALS